MAAVTWRMLITLLAMADFALGLFPSTFANFTSPSASISSTFTSSIASLNSSTSAFYPTASGLPRFNGNLKCYGHGNTFAGTMSNVRNFCAEKSGVNFTGPTNGMLSVNDSGALLGVTQPTLNTSESFSEADCLRNMLYVLWKCPSSDGQAPIGTYQSNDGLTWWVNLIKSSKRTVFLDAAIEARQTDASPILRCTTPGQNSYTDIEEDVRDFCAKQAGSVFEYLTQSSYQYGSVSVFQWCGFLSIQETFTEQKCLDNMMHILNDCPASNGLSPRGRYITESDCLGWVISAADNIIDNQPSTTRRQATPAEPRESNSIVERQSTTCDSDTPQSGFNVNLDLLTFCADNYGAQIFGRMSQGFPGATYSVSVCSSGHGDTREEFLNAGDCWTNFLTIMRACAAGVQGVHGGSYTDNEKCLTYSYQLHGTSRRARQADPIVCAGDRLLASGVALKNATDSFCTTFNGWTLKHNNIISEQMTLDPKAGYSPGLKANVTITNSCFEFFTWYKPCEASFDSLIDYCDYGDMETSGGVVKAGDNDCVEYSLAVYEDVNGS